MKTIKSILVVLLFVFPFFSATVFALDFFEISKPAIKKASIYVAADTDSALNKQFIARLKKMLDASLLFENVTSKRNSDYSITLGNSIESKDLLVTIVGEKQNTFKTKFFGIRFQSTDSEYVARRTSQMANRIIKEFFGIEGSVGSILTWSVTEESRKVIHKASFAVDDSQKQVTFNFYSNYGGSWNPSQDYIIYTSHTDFGTVMNVQQLEPLIFNSTEVYKQAGQASSPIWAPDDTIYLTLHVSDQNSDIFQFKIEGKLGGNEPITLTRIRQLTDNASIETEPALSPDNTKMAYVSDRTSEPQIYILDIASKKSTRLTQKGNYNVSPSWSPKGNYLAFRSIRDGVSSIYRIDLSTNEETALTGKAIETEDPTWSPDGSLIVFAGKTDKKATSKIYYMLSTGGEFRRLTASEAGVEETSPNWGPALR